MHRLAALVVAIALVLPSAGHVDASNGGSGGTAAGAHAFGRVLIGDASGPVGWVSFDVHRPSDARPGYGTFRFDGLPSVPTYPATTRSIITYADFYHEPCCGVLDVVVIFGTECKTFATGDSYCHEFVAGFYDGGSGTRHDFFRWGNQGEEMTEYWTGKGSLTVNLGP